MNKYLVFVNSIYYPFGGWKDYRGSCLTLEEAQNLAEDVIKQEDYSCPWAHITDKELEKIVSTWMGDRWEKAKNES